MSVYTPLSHVQIASFVDKYNFSLLDFSAIKTGIENSNYFVSVQTKEAAQTVDAVLTLFEQLSFEHASLLVVLLNHLQANGVPVALPFRTQNLQFIDYLAQKPAQLAPKLAGSHPDLPNAAQCYQIGKMLARMHNVLKPAFLQEALAPILARTAPDNPLQWHQLVSSHPHLLTEEDKTLLKELFAHLYRNSDTIAMLPKGLTHGDLFRDNTLFVADTVSGVLDFSEISVQPYIYDIAICINDFCSGWPNVHLQAVHYSQFITGYQTERMLTTNELLYLPLYMALAAARFWLSRLYTQYQNQTLARNSHDILQKDPAQMKRMLEDRMSILTML